MCQTSTYWQVINLTLQTKSITLGNTKSKQTMHLQGMGWKKGSASQETIILLPSSFSQKRSSPSVEPEKNAIFYLTNIGPARHVKQQTDRTQLGMGDKVQPVIIPLSIGEYSTHNIGPAWHARTASQVPRETDHILAVQSSLPVIKVSPTILIDLHSLHTK